MNAPRPVLLLRILRDRRRTAAARAMLVAVLADREGRPSVAAVLRDGARPVTDRLEQALRLLVA